MLHRRRSARVDHGSETSSRPPTIRQSNDKTQPPHKWRWGSAAVVVISLLLAASTLWLYMKAPDPEEAPARSSWLPPPQCKQAAAPPMVCAHGGDTSGGHPPGTLEAFRKAADSGLPCIEVDVAATADEQLVVLHTRQLRTLLPGRADVQVGDLSAAEVAALTWPGGERVPAVEEVLTLAAASRFQHITLDIKTYEQDSEESKVALMARLTAALLRRVPCPTCLAWSKSDALMAAIRQAHPEARLGYIVINETAAHRAAGMDKLPRLPAAEVIGMHHEMATAASVAAAHAANQRVHAFTANTPTMMQRVLDAGVDAAVTDFPHAFLQAAVEHVQQCRAL